MHLFFNQVDSMRTLERTLRRQQATSKITIPGRKWVYRLLGVDGVPILDIMLKDGEEAPQPGVPILAR